MSSKLENKPLKDNDGKRVLSPVVSSELLANWDTAIVDLYRNDGMFVAYDVRLRNCNNIKLQQNEKSREIPKTHIPS